MRHYWLRMGRSVLQDGPERKVRFCEIMKNTERVGKCSAMVDVLYLGWLLLSTISFKLGMFMSAVGCQQLGMG